MKPRKSPDFVALGYADYMGPKLRALVESQLAEDLRHYGVRADDLKFDWSDSCIEGHRTKHLDGSVENFSGIAVFDHVDQLVAEGWMEFVHDEAFFQAYWEFVSTWDGQRKLKEKKEGGIPVHIWKRLPEATRPKYKSQRL